MAHGTQPDPSQDRGPQLEAIAARFGGPLRSYFRKRACDLHEAEDLVQEVFCRLAARTEDLQLEKPEAYIFQMAANLLRDRARRQLTRSAATRELEAQERNSFEDISPERVLIGRRRVAELQRALKELPERTRAIFLLQRFEDFTYSEIARRLGISTSSVEKHMMDAIRHLTAKVGRDR